MSHLQEHLDYHYATDAELDRAGATEVGANNVESAWILSSRDVWYANPNYTGAAEPHPEDDYAWRTL